MGNSTKGPGADIASGSVSRITSRGIGSQKGPDVSTVLGPKPSNQFKGDFPSSGKQKDKLGKAKQATVAEGVKRKKDDVSDDEEDVQTVKKVKPSGPSSNDPTLSKGISSAKRKAANCDPDGRVSKVARSRVGSVSMM